MKAISTLDANIRVQGKDTVIHFDDGLIGFPDCKDFQVMQSDSIAPFHLLQSSHTKEVGFLVLEPSVVMPDYYRGIPSAEWEWIGVTAGDPCLAFVICVIGASPEKSVGNFKAPLIINYRKMVGRQLILADADLSIRRPLGMSCR